MRGLRRRSASRTASQTTHGHARIARVSILKILFEGNARLCNVMMTLERINVRGSITYVLTKEESQEALYIQQVSFHAHSYTFAQ